MLYFSLARTIFTRNSSRARALLANMKSENAGHLLGRQGAQENLFSRTGKPVPEDLQVYYSSATFDWHRTWASADCNVGSSRTLLIKGRHYAHFPKVSRHEVDNTKAIEEMFREQRRKKSLILFLVSFFMSSLMVFVAALNW